MRRKQFWLGLILCASIQANAQQSMTQTFNDAKALGATSNASRASNISTGTAKDVVPAYGQSTPESSYFQGGDGNTAAQGVAKLQNCQAGGQGGTAVQQQECEAVNFLAKNPDVRPQFNISKSDAMVQATRGFQNSAESILGSLGNGTNTECVVKNETVPAKYESNTCVSIKQVDPQQCTMGRVIKTDADSNFQCNQTVSAYDTVKCNKSPYFNTTVVPSCTLGSTVYAQTHSNSLNQDPCEGGDSALVTYVCEITDKPKIGINIYKDQFGPLQVSKYVGPDPFEVTVQFSNCQATMRGNTYCSNGSCAGNYSIDIFYGEQQAYCRGLNEWGQIETYPAYRCSWDSGCTGYYCGWGSEMIYGDPRGTYSGTMNLTSTFQLYSKSTVYAGMTDTCQALEARTK